MLDLDELPEESNGSGGSGGVKFGNGDSGYGRFEPGLSPWVFNGILDGGGGGGVSFDLVGLGETLGAG